IARRNGFKESSVTSDYLDKLKKRELIGSSQRYGHLFESENIWALAPHIQMYLDSIAANILPNIK
ncbi:MAG: hypothetical protein ACTHJ7_11765, partial [Candidatus Nitrosocosmicus sp.]